MANSVEAEHSRQNQLQQPQSPENYFGSSNPQCPDLLTKVCGYDGSNGVWASSVAMLT